MSMSRGCLNRPLRAVSTWGAPGDASLIQLAVSLRRESIVAAVRELHFVRAPHLELPLTQIPGVDVVALFAWPEPTYFTRRIDVDIVRVNRFVLPEPLSLRFDLGVGERPGYPPEVPREVPLEASEALRRRSAWPTDRPDTVTILGPDGPVVWTRVEPCTAQEVQKLEVDGTPVLALVDTEAACYRMTCEFCGRLRYARPNSLHQVFACRVCTRVERLRRRALQQYRARHGRPRE